MTLRTFIASLASLIAFSCCQRPQNNDIQAVQGQFIQNEEPVYFVGANLWYAGRLAATEEGIARLEKELDYLHGIGVDNLRILAAEGEDIKALGKALEQLDRRGMKAVLFLNNAWEWSYGFADYLDRATGIRQPRPSTDSYPAYMEAMSCFSTNAQAVALNHEYIKTVVEALKDSDAIFSWQICNEPRSFSEDKDKKQALVDYLHSTARLIKSIDPRHMVSTGNEGLYGSEMDMEQVRRINDCKAIDYMTIHIWPYNWKWAREDSLAADAPVAVEKVKEYITSHAEIARSLSKPMVIEEFGYPRDGFSFSKDAPTSGRDAVYSCVFDAVLESKENSDVLAGCNFWGWGGFAEPSHTWWEEGDDFCNDPAQEQQGLNSVFVGDSTVELIKKSAEAIQQTVSARVAMQHSWLFTGKDKTLEVSTFGPSSKSVEVRLALVSDRSLMLEADTFYVSTVKVNACSKAAFDLDSVEPGFYQVRITYTADELQRSLKPFNIGIEPEKIISRPDVDKEEFDAFWSGALKELAAVPMDARMEVYPEYSNDIRTTYKVYVNSTDGAVMGGILCVPVKEGKYPVYLEYMGYGADVYPFDPSSEPERIQFLVSVRGQGIFRESEGRWIDRGLQDKDAFYYKGAYCDVVRAIDFVCTLEKADTTRILALGESQGGAFTIVAAGLDSRIKAAAPAVPFMGDFADYWKIVWWPVWEVFDAAKEQGLNREQVLDVMRFFDTKNFAAGISCPVKMGFGLQDPTCPPHTNFAPYNLIQSEKSYVCYPYCGHGIWQVDDWRTEREAFFAQF